MANPHLTLHTNETLASSEQPFYVIAIGASAGGLAPLEELFQTVTKVDNVAFVVIQHLPKEHKSMMKDLLMRKCDLPIEEVKHRKKIKPGNVYLMPPGKLMTINAGCFLLKNKPNEKTLGYPIDVFLQSLAEQMKEHAIAVILSGTGSDGAKGIRFIKEEEGLVLVQRPASAQFDGMPRNAIATGHVDMILPVKKMLPASLKYMKRKSPEGGVLGGKPLEKDKIFHIIQLLKEKKGVDFTRYKREFVLRRIFRAIQLCQADSLASYLAYLKNKEEALDDLFHELLLGVTQFFRDPGACRCIKDNVLPELFRKIEGNTLRIWVAGCSTGEEAYTLAIMIQEFMELNNLHHFVKIFATDANEKSIEFATKGHYAESIARDVPIDLLTKYFKQSKSGYTVNRKIREMIVFTRHNIIEDVPFNQLDLISCRNVLIYFQAQIQYQVFAAFNFALRQNRFLWLGTSETTDAFKEVFRPLEKKYNIYRSAFRSVDKGKYKLPSLIKPQKRQNQQMTVATGQITMRLRLLEAANEVMIQELGAAGMLINDRMELLRYFGNAGKYLSVPNEPGVWSLLKMVSSEVAAILNAAVRRSKEENQRVYFREIKISNSRSSELCNLTIIPYRHQALDGTLFMIIIRVVEELPKTSTMEAIQLDDSLSERITDLEHELKLNRENLQSTIEELQTSNEELMTANEELQGTNEELQSVNEELYTINAEHQKTIEMISDLNNDLDNLLRHTHLGILFLDARLRIRRFNAALKEEIHVTEADIGRPISHFSSQLNYRDLEEDASNVLNKGMILEKEITSESGKWYMIKILPYEVGENKPSGIVCTLVDISKVKGAERLKELSHTNAEQDIQIKELKALNEQLLLDKQRCEEEFQAFVDLSPIAMLKFNSKGNLNHQVISKSFPTRLSESRDSLPIAKLLNEKNRVLLSKGLEEAEYVSPDEIQPIRLIQEIQGEKHIQEVRISPRDIEGQLIGLFEQTEFYSLKEELQKAQELKRLMAKNSPDGFVIVYDPELICQFSEGEFMWKVQEGETVQSPLESERAQVENACRSALKGKPKQIELVREQDAFVANFIPVEAESGEIYAGLIIGQRITDMKKVQRDLQARLQDMEQFAYSVSHDLKSPIRSIVGFAQLLQKQYEGIFDDTAKEYFDFIINNTKGMAKLIHGLLNYARLGSHEKQPEVVNITEIVEEVTDKLNALLNIEGVQLTCDELPDTLGFPEHMIQLFQNLIENGLKFNESETKTIHISAIKKGKWIRYSVKDNGIGIDEQYHEQIFEIFKHLNTRDKYEGSGIGLSQCKRIVERMNGRLWLESKKGEGATFNFTLPAVESN